MAFLLKKIVSLFLLPLPFCLILFAVGFILSRLQLAKRLRMACFVIGFTCLLAFSLRINAYYLINLLQSQYPPLLHPPQNVSKIVVLGGGISGGKNYPPNITLNAASLSRLIEGIRLFHQLEKEGKQPQLILSGGRVFQSTNTSAGVMRNTAVMLGINANNILLEDGSKDTYDEAQFLKPILKKHPFLLVTSAYHMPRSMALFESAGMRPIAAPTQYFGPTNLKIRSYIPNATALLVSDIAIHEYLGMLWEKMKGYIKSAEVNSHEK